MSNALALAAISAALTGLLDDSISKLGGAFGNVKVTAQAPDLIKPDAVSQPQLNLFMYQVSPNPGWANLKLPAIDSRGQRVANLPLALDLHYLLTVYAREDFRAEILLGHAMQCFHEAPALTRQRLQKFAEKWSEEGAPFAALAGSGVAEQVEQLKISPEPFGVEELSKLWTAFQVSYRPTVAYRVSVALIESDLPARSALPVLERGGTVASDLASPFPVLVAVVPPEGQPAVRAGETLALVGLNLLGDAGDEPRVVVRRPRAGDAVTLQQTRSAPDGLTVTIPADALPAGNYGATVEYWRDGKLQRSTNALPFTLAPKITRNPLAVRKNGKVTVTVDAGPPVREGQRVSLLLNDREATGAPVSGAAVTSLVFDFDGLPPGDYWARLRVDGVESLLVDRAARSPRFDDTQKVTVP